MPIARGTTLGTYEVTAHIGSGGMGEVYQAHDTKLGRDVAIKVLPEQFARDPERLARFQREAKMLAALNHPNIAAIYGLEQSGNTHYLVMELVPGETLRERVAGGRPLPVEEALSIAKQIAEALEAAHNSEKGIIHRDLKPANVKVTPEGRVKVLDFGLAKAFANDASSEDIGNSPTLSMAATVQGVIMGTAAYMSPEQARGRAVNKATDIFAFGAVLYELLTGKQAFQGDDVSDILAAVIRAEPDWTALPADVPPAIRTLLARCLAKDRKQRMRDIGDVQLILNGAFEAPAQPAAAATPPVAVPRPLWKRAIPLAAAALVASAIVGAAVWTLRPPAPSSPVTRFALALGEGQQFTVTNNQILAVSPDGTRLVYVAGTQLYLRSMSDLEARPLAGTQQTENPASPVFSPDGQSIAFYSITDSTIKKIAVSGGAAVTLCPASGTALGRMSWDASGIVFYQLGKGIMRVSANGGQPEMLVAIKDDEVMDGPQVLPGGEWVLFTTATGATALTADTWDAAQIVAQSLKSSERKTLVSGGSAGLYLPTGHIVYALGGVLFAVPFVPTPQE
jgi:eukaryotic-like serine/threonine-protein kinase